MPEQQPGWYPDPAGNVSKLRYWDGASWTSEFSDLPAQSAQMPVQPQQPQAILSETTYSYAPESQTRLDPGYGQGGYYMDENKRTLRMVAFIFNLISLITVCWLIIPLAWMIPMTVYSWGIYKGTKPNTTVFGVCTLIFLSLVGGILLLVSGEDRPANQ